MSNAKLPHVKSGIPQDLRLFIDRVRDIFGGTGANKLITANDLVSGRLATLSANGTLSPVTTDTYLATPPAPTSVAANGAIQNIIVSWGGSNYYGHAYSEVWGSATNDLGAAVLLGQTPGELYVDAVGPSTTRYYWVRFVNREGTTGPYNATAGTAGTTGSDVTYTLGLLANQITTSELSSSLNSRINLIDGPATTIGTIPYYLAQVQGQIDAINSYPDYDNATTYATNDIVKYNSGLYKAIASTTGNLPTDTNYWAKIGDYTSIADAVVTIAEDLSTAITNLGVEVTDRQALSLAILGTSDTATVEGLTGVGDLTTGLLYNEKYLRETQDGVLAGQITTVSATANGKNKIYRQATAPASPAVNDIWVDTRVSYSESYFDGDFAVPKHKQYQWDGTTWLGITDNEIYDNHAYFISEQTARISSDEAIVESITQLEAQVNLDIGVVQANITNEEITRAGETGALATRATTLEASVTDVDSRVTTVETTKIGYCTIDGVASDDTNKTDCEAAGGVWHVGVPLATAVKQVAISDGSTTASLEQRFTAQKTVNDTIASEYTLKIDDGGIVSGFGLRSEGGTSTFIASVNQFGVEAPLTSVALWASSTTYAVGDIVRVSTNNSRTLVCKIAGVSGTTAPSVTAALGSLVEDNAVTWQIASRVPFAVQSTPATINGTSVPAGVYVDAAYILNATVNNAQIANAAIDDAKIIDLSASKLKTGGIEVGQEITSTDYIPGTQGWAIKGNGTAEFQTAVVRGTVYATDGQFNGEVIAQGSGGNKARMYYGNVEIYKDVPGVGSVQYKALTRTEFGQGNNNVEVTIPGYFTNQPKIIVSPANIKLYDAAYSNQSQSIQFSASNIVETSAGSMSWKFTPVATLSLAASTGQTVINQTSGTISGNWYSSQYTTPANTTSITGSVYLASNRGNGSSQYYYRTVRARLEYYSGSTWVVGSWVTVNLGADTAANTTVNPTLTLPSSGSWTIRAYCEAYDTDGSVFGSVSYDYSVNTVSASGSASNTWYALGTNTLSYALPSNPAPSGYTVYSVSYSESWNFSRTGYYTAIVSVGGQFVVYNSTSASLSGTRNWTSSSYSTSALNATVTVNRTSTLDPNYGSVTVGLSSGSATVYSRKAQVNSTTANNVFTFNSYDYDLSTAQVLATGSLNWVAIGD